MKYCLAWICGSLLAAAASLGLAWLNDAHIGRCLSFLLIGSGSGLLLAGLGLLLLGAVWCSQPGEKSPPPAARGLAICFLLPFCLVLGAAWLVALDSSAV